MLRMHHRTVKHSVISAHTWQRVPMYALLSVSQNSFEVWNATLLCDCWLSSTTFLMYFRLVTSGTLQVIERSSGAIVLEQCILISKGR